MFSVLLDCLVFCPLAGKSRLFLGPFLSAPAGVSGLRAALLPTLGCMSQNENPRNSLLCRSSGPEIDLTRFFQRLNWIPYIKYLKQQMAHNICLIKLKITIIIIIISNLTKHGLENKLLIFPLRTSNTQQVIKNSYFLYCVP